MDLDYAKYLLEKTRQDYNLIAEDFSRTRYFIWKDLEPLSQYTLPGDRVLDLGCGNGRLLQAFEGIDIDYTGVDNSEKLIEIAKKRYPKNKFQVTDALKLPFPNNYFNKVYSIAVLHHIPSQEFRLQFLNETKRVLKKEGLLVLTVWNLWQRKTAWRLFFQYSFLKLINKSKMDFKDIFYPWESQKGKVLIQRYFHLFNKKELERLTKKASFKIKEIGILKRPEMKDNNIYLVAEK